MNRFSKKQEVPFDVYVENVQLGNFMKNLDKAFEKSNRKYLFRSLVLVGPLLIGLGYFVLGSMPLIIVGMGITIAGTGAMTISDLNSEVRKGTREYYERNIYSELSETLEPEQVLIIEKEQKMSKAEDFYTEQARTVVATPVSGEYLKYQEALEKQKASRVWESGKTLGFNDTITAISTELYNYSKVFQVPPIEIKESTWNALFESVFEVISSKGQANEYYDYMSDLSKCVVARSLVEGKESLGIEEFLEELSVGSGVSEEDIINIQRNIRSLNKRKILDINEYSNRPQ